jgi:2-polyprenyl-6-hydroxyphenyl methylase/3-demethylubiquinone-9 3-methyltransferase
MHDPALGSDADADRFSFGENWLAYAARVDEHAITRAERSLRELLKVDRLTGLRFLDAGSGSGLFSLAARRLGATVVSFDFDEHSVRCTASLKARYFDADPSWRVIQGSVLDEPFVASLGQFDIVYSWGVLHHTGDMWRAIATVAPRTRAGGLFCVALYNDQGRMSRVWRSVKRTYNRLPARLRFLVLWPAFVRLWGPTLVRDTLRGRPLATWREYGRERGMSPVNDVRDWVGGYPFEVATREQVVAFCGSRQFELVNLVSRSGIGCNEFVFRKA